MSRQAFLAHPRRQGWRYDYANGKLKMSSAEVVVPLVLALRKNTGQTTEQSSAYEEVTFRRLADVDDDAMVDLFVESFADAMEYLGKSLDEVRQSAVESLARGELLRRGRRHECSWVASLNGNSVNGELIGAALFRHARQSQGEQVPLLDLIFVAPSWQRRGLAHNLFQRAVADLHDAGVERIHSSVMLGNEASYAWHQSQGFEEMPHYLPASHRASFYRTELDRHERLRDLDAGELEALREKAKHWEEERRRLAEAMQTNPRLAFPNIY